MKDSLGIPSAAGKNLLHAGLPTVKKTLDDAQIQVSIHSDDDILAARRKARELAVKTGFSTTDATLIATAVSELARNIVLYAREGEIVEKVVYVSDQACLIIVANDAGPGIPDVERAMQVGYSTSRSLGLGLPGVKRLMDEFEITSENGKGTTVVAKKWLR